MKDLTQANADDRRQISSGRMLSGAILIAASMCLVFTMGPTPANAALITFSAIAQESGHTAGWFGNPSSSYQPLDNNYVVDGTADGANLGITVDMTDFIAADTGGGHTGNTNDYYIKDWGGDTTPRNITFSSPIKLSSFWIWADYNAGANGSYIKVYTNAADTTAAATFSVSNTDNGWNQVTTFADQPITKLSLYVPNGNVLIDDMTVTSATPEPASAALCLVAIPLIFWRRRRTSH